MAWRTMAGQGGRRIPSGAVRPCRDAGDRRRTRSLPAGRRFPSMARACAVRQKPCSSALSASLSCQPKRLSAREALALPSAVRLRPALPPARRRSSAGLRPPCAPALAQASGSGSAGLKLPPSARPAQAVRRTPAEASQRLSAASATLASTLSGSAPATRSEGILARPHAMPVRGSLRRPCPQRGAQRPGRRTHPKFSTLRTGAEMTNSVISDPSALADPSGGG